MSKESYARGFVKAAAAKGVDPTALAIMTKSALSFSDIASAASKALGSARDAWHSIDDQYKPLAGALLGAAGGGLAGAVGGGITGLGAGKGALLGAGIGGVGGGLYGSHSARKGYLKALKNERAARAKEKQDLENQLIEADAATTAERTSGENALKAQADKLNADRDKALADLAAKHKGEVGALNAGFEKERKSMQAASDKAKAALNKELETAKSQNEALRIIKDNLKGFENLPPKTQEAIYRETLRNLELAQKQVGGIEAYRRWLWTDKIRQAMKGMKPNAGAVDSLKKKQEGRNARALRDIFRRADQESEKEQRVREPMKDAPTFVLPAGMRL